MPERILRDLTDSEAWNAVPWHAQSLFVRILNKVDDYGCYFADAKRLRSFLYPLLLDQVREADLSRWIEEMAKPVSEEIPGLVRLYEVDGRRYLEVTKWARQRLRAKHRKYPLPPWRDASDGHVPDIRSADAGHPPSDADSDADNTPKPPQAGAKGSRRRRRSAEERFADDLAASEAENV